MKSKTVIATFVVFYLAFFSSSVFGQTDYRLSLIKKFYAMGTATINGTYYPVGNSISRIFSKQINGIGVLAEPTAGSMANIEFLRRNLVDLALVQSDVAWQAFSGQGFFSQSRYRELKVLASLYSELMQIVVKNDSDIKTIHDLKGKRIAVGDRESGSAASVMLILEAAGLGSEDYTLVYERFTRATESLADGYVDVLYYTGGVPADGLVRLASRHELRFIAVPDNVRHNLTSKYPYFTSEIIPRGAYHGQNREIMTIGLRALLVCSDGIPEVETHKMLQVLFDNINNIIDQKQQSIRLRLEDALKGVETEMLHPGARKFYEARQMLKSVSAN